MAVLRRFYRIQNFHLGRYIVKIYGGISSRYTVGNLILRCDFLTYIRRYILSEMVLLSTYNIYFDQGIRKLISNNPFLLGDLNYLQIYVARL